MNNELYHHGVLGMKWNDLHLKNTPEVEQFIVDNMDWNTIGRYDNTTRLTKHEKKQIIR